MRNNTKHGERPCITPAGVTQQCSGQEPVLVEWESPAVPGCELHPGCARDAFPACAAEEEAHNGYSGRKLSSLPPASSPSRGITCLPTPLCRGQLPVIPQLSLGQSEPGSKPHRNRTVLLCSAASSEEVAAVLMALLLPDERRGVFRSNKSTDVKAISAFSLTLHINRNVLKCFFVPFSI